MRSRTASLPLGDGVPVPGPGGAVRRALRGAFAAVSLSFGWAHATPAVTLLGRPAAPEVMIQVGDASGAPSVTIQIPAARVGDGTPVSARAPVRIVAVGRRSGNAGAMVLSVDSSVPLSNGTHVLPLSELSWESDLGNVPAGRFTGGPAQVLVRTAAPQARIEEVKRFFYANRAILAPGVYTGRVTYTVSFP